MRLTFSLLVFNILVASLALTARAAPADPAAPFRNLKAGKPQTVLVYGTSLTHGGAWSKAVKEWFATEYPDKVTFINSGGPGQNSDWGLANLKTKVLNHHPDLVFIEFSYNDAHDKFKMPVERGAENLSKIVTAIRAENPSAVIVLQTMNIGWDAPNGNRSQSVRPQLELFNDNYRKLARDQGLPLLDHYAVWKKLKETEPKTYQSYVPDGTHPSAKGSLAVTWPTIKTWLETTQSAAAK